MSVNSAAHQPPDNFGPYEVYERLGLGGMAVVHRAKKRGIEGFERSVALKRILAHLAENRNFVVSFIREAKVSSLLVHPNIAQVYDFGRIDGVYYIAMELVQGFDIRKLLHYASRTGESIPIPVLLSILSEMADALDYAHTFIDEHGQHIKIVHRDISPSNLIVDHSGHLKVIDFGIAKASTMQQHTENGQVKGKLGYMSPEAALGMNLDPVSDLFSMGVVAWELVTASPLFSSRTDFETMWRIREADIVPPSVHNPSCPPELDAVILAALERNSARRLPSAGAFRAALEALATRYGYHHSPRHVAEWLTKFAQPGDVWVRPSLQSFSAAHAVVEIDSTNLEHRRAQSSRTPAMVQRSPEQAQLAHEIWGENSGLEATTDAAIASSPLTRSVPPLVAPPEPNSAQQRPSQPYLSPDTSQPYGSPDASQPYPSQAYPSQPYPSQAYASQPYPSQPYPSQGYPSQGYPSQAYPSQAYPSGAYPSQPYPSGAHPSQPYSQPYPSVAQNPEPFQRPMLPPRKRTGMFVALLAVVAAALGATLVVRMRKPTPSAPAVKTAPVHFAVEPANAVIEIAGRQVEKDLELPAGEHPVVVKLEGHKTWTRSIVVRADEAQTIDVKLERVMAHVTIESEPPGLAIEIDGKPSGYATPASFDQIPGTHQIVIRNGTEVWTKELVAEVDGKHTMVAKLTPQPPLTRSAMTRYRVGYQRSRDREPKPEPPVKIQDTPSQPAAENKQPQTEAEPPPTKTTTTTSSEPKVVAPKDTRIPVVAASAVTKLTGEMPRLKGNSGETSSDALVKVCIDRNGRVTSVRVVKSSSSIAGELESALSTWHYKPYVGTDGPSAVCFPLQLRLLFKSGD